VRYLTLGETLELYRKIIEQSGSSLGIRDLDALESAIAQPRMTFGGEDLYPTVVEKASALGFSLIMNHPFVDGNKRTSLCSRPLARRFEPRTIPPASQGDRPYSAFCNHRAQGISLQRRCSCQPS